MAKPKINSTIIKSVDIEPISNPSLDQHINDESIHVDSNTKDNIKYLKENVDKHIQDEDIHVSKLEKDTWNNKETPAGAQSKANKVLSTLNAHKADTISHITKEEKDSFKDKYTKAETRNLLKHSITGLTFLVSVYDRTELNKKYPNPEFNSCTYIKNEHMTVIYNGKEWVEFNGIFTPEATTENDGMMSFEDKIKLDGIAENATNYVHPDNVDTRHVTDAQINYWNDKAESNLVDYTSNGLMTKEDKIKLDGIAENATNYEHPDTHPASMIVEDSTHKFVTDKEKDEWNTKAEVSYVNESIDKSLTTAKAFTDSKIASMLNSTDEQLQVLRSLSFELKNADTIKEFFDLYNECAKTTDLTDHIVNNSAHMSKEDRILLNDVKEAIKDGVNPDWNETNQSSMRFIENKPTSLPANGGDAHTIDGHGVDELLDKNNFYDYILDHDNIDNIISNLNNQNGQTVLVRSGKYYIEKQIVIKANNTIIRGIGTSSRLVDASIKIIGNNNTIENITFCSGQSVVNGIAIHVQGDNNIIKSNTIINYDQGIVVEGSNNITENNNIESIRKEAIRLNSDNNSNYGNIVEKNNIKNADIGILLMSSSNTLTKNNINKNKVLNCYSGIILSNTKSDYTKTTMNIISENFVMRGNGNSSDYHDSYRTITSEFSSKNIITSNITAGKDIYAPNDILSNNIF